MNVYVFKTSVSSEDIRHINSILRSIIPGWLWNYDLEDCDKILRIKSDKDIVELVNFHLEIDGFHCEELEHQLKPIQ